MMSFTTRDKIASNFTFDNIYKFTDQLSQFSDSITSIIWPFCCFFWPPKQWDCKSSHRKSDDNLLFKNLIQV